MTDQIITNPNFSDDSSNELKEPPLNPKFLQKNKSDKGNTKSLPTSSGGSTNTSRNASFSFLPIYESKEYFDYNSVTDTIFPVLVPDKIAKRKSKRKSSHDLWSPGFESPVQEENAENEDDVSHKILKQVRIMSDGEEFNERITKISQRRKGRELDMVGTSARSISSDTSHLPLHRVQEMKAEDDYPKIPLKTKFYLESILDMNEFNTPNKEQIKHKIGKPNKGEPQVERSRTAKKFSTRLSSQTADEETIPEDLVQENKEIFEIHVPAFSNSSSSASSRHNSPRFKLKVDEIDLGSKEKKVLDNFPLEEPILEETAAEEGQENKLLQAAKHKLLNEKEFIKKFIKSEDAGEADCVRSNLMASDKEITIMQSETIQEVEEEKLCGGDLQD